MTKGASLPVLAGWDKGTGCMYMYSVKEVDSFVYECLRTSDSAYNYTSKYLSIITTTASKRKHLHAPHDIFQLHTHTHTHTHTQTHIHTHLRVKG